MIMQDDIIIINSYKENENVKTESRIYIQGSDQKFTLDKDLSTRVNENGSLTTVADIVDYLNRKNRTQQKYLLNPNRKILDRKLLRMNGNRHILTG